MIRWMAIAAFAVSTFSLLAQSTAPQPKVDAKLEATRGPVAALKVDKAERPSAN